MQLYAGIDEAGRGPLAGPVTAAAVVLPVSYRSDKIADSKLLSPQKREEAYEEIVRRAIAYAIVSVGPRRIEALNIREATRLAMSLAASRLLAKLHADGSNKDVHFLVDGDTAMPGDFSQKTIVGGDRTEPVISAASILAKVTRDRLLLSLDTRYPNYGFAKHKGYPTQFHRDQIAALGPCRIHRMTFAGVKEHISLV